MKFGHFSDTAREYVITTPRTPLPWINYLGSEAFFSLVSHTAGGYSFYRDAKLRRITRYRYNNVPADSNGRYYYIKDGDTVWNPGWQPTQTELDSYECRHGLGYSIITGKKNSLTAKLELFVPVGDNCEIDRLVLTNESDVPKSFTVFSYRGVLPLERCGRFHQLPAQLHLPARSRSRAAPSTTRPNTVSAATTTHCSPSTTPIDGFDTSRDAFLGAMAQQCRTPRSVENGALHQLCRPRLGTRWRASSQCHPAARRKPQPDFCFGLYRKPARTRSGPRPASSIRPAPRRWLARYATDAQVDAALARLARPLEQPAVHLLGQERRRKARPYGQYLEPVPVHGHLQHVPLRLLL